VNLHWRLSGLEASADLADFRQRQAMRRPDMIAQCLSPEQQLPLASLASTSRGNRRSSSCAVPLCC
jgi:hypothetical protein